MDSNTTVDTIKKEDILDTVSKPIWTTHYKRWNNPEKQLLLPGGVFYNQGFFYATYLHHPKAYRIDAPPNHCYVSRGCFFHCNN
jgi:activator of 2-hydroxyglutaryl-CoA dehydratase